MQAKAGEGDRQIKTKMVRFLSLCPFLSSVLCLPYRSLYYVPRTDCSYPYSQSICSLASGRAARRNADDRLLQLLLPTLHVDACIFSCLCPSLPTFSIFSCAPRVSSLYSILSICFSLAFFRLPLFVSGVFCFGYVRLHVSSFCYLLFVSCARIARYAPCTIITHDGLQSTNEKHLYEFNNRQNREERSFPKYVCTNEQKQEKQRERQRDIQDGGTTGVRNKRRTKMRQEEEERALYSLYPSYLTKRQ